MPKRRDGYAVRMVPIGTITPYPNNPRNNADAVATVARSITKYGWRQPVVVDANNVIIAGDTRYKAAIMLGLNEIPVHVAADLSPELVRQYRVADNRVGELAEWDLPLLEAEMAEIMAADADIDAIGWDADELRALFADLHADGAGGDEDIIPPAPVVPVTAAGDLWVMGNHRLLCGDSTQQAELDILISDNQMQMVFTDPPYGVNYEGGHFHSGDVNIKRKREQLGGDLTTDIYRLIIPIILKTCNGPCYVWFAGTRARDLYNSVIDNGGMIHAMIVWHKINATYAAMNAQYKQRHEPLLYFKGKQATLRWIGPSDENTLWEIKRDGVNNYHPTQKPVDRKSVV